MPKKVIFSGNCALDSNKRHKYSKVDFSVSVVKGIIIQNIIVLGQRDGQGYAPVRHSTQTPLITAAGNWDW
jgi:hypothetical protein